MFWNNFIDSPIVSPRGSSFNLGLLYHAIPASPEGERVKFIGKKFLVAVYCNDCIHCRCLFIFVLCSAYLATGDGHASITW